MAGPPANRSTKPPVGRPVPPETKGSRPARPSGAVDRAMALRDVMDHAVRAERANKRPQVVRRGRGGQVFAVVACTALLTFSAWSFIARPAFIWGAPTTLPVAQEGAHARVALFMLGERLRAFRAQAGYYPAALTEIGEQSAGIHYRRLADSLFELRAMLADSSAIVYLSNQPADAFLGNSLNQITNAPR